MKSYRFILISLLIILAQAQSYAQLKNYISGIDTMKFKNTMNFRDIYLPRDYYNIEPTKPKFGERLFENPLYGFDIASFYSGEISNLNINSLEPFLSHVFNDLHLIKPDVSEMNALMPRIMLNDLLGVNLDSAFGSLGSIIMSRYITTYIVGRTILEKRLNSVDFKILSFMIMNADSIIYNPKLDTDNFFDYRDNLAKYKKITDEFVANQWILDSLQTMSVGISIFKEIIKTNDIVKNNFINADTSIKSAVIDTKYGKIALGGIGKDKYKGDYALIIDLGGDDIYECTVNDKMSNISNPIRLIVDFSGNDSYKSGNYGLGCGYFGVNAIFDLSGDDKYQAGNFSLGCGIFGLGAIFDYSGNDSYISQSFSQASSFFGVGFIIDSDGNDNYQAKNFSQAFTGPKSFAFLSDKSGNDNYTITVKSGQAAFSQAASLGMPGYMGGGIALLVDNSGDDIYKGATCSQAFSSWYSFAALIDFEGDDEFSATNLSQAVAFNTSHAYLIKQDGESKFSAISSSQAFASGLSFAALQAKGTSEFSMPKKNANHDFGVSLLFTNMNYNDSSIYTFVDHILSDNQQSQVVAAGTVYSASSAQATNFKSPPNQFFKLPIVNLDLTAKNFKEPKLESNLSDLISIAVSERLPKQMSESAVEAMIDDSTLTLRGFCSILAEEPTIATPLLRKFTNHFDHKPFLSILEDSLRSVNQNTIINSINMIVELNNQASFDKIAEQHSNVNWIVRINVAENIAKFNKGSYSVILRLLLEDNHPYVRAAAAKSLALSDPKPENLANALNDSMFVVRNSAILGLSKNPKLDLKQFSLLLPLCSSDESSALFANLVPNIEFKKREVKSFEKMLVDAPHGFIKALYFNPNLIQDEKLKLQVAKIYNGFNKIEDTNDEEE